MAFEVLTNTADHAPGGGDHYYRIRADDAETTSRILLGEVPSQGTIYRVRASDDSGTLLPRFIAFAGDLAQTVAAGAPQEIGEPPTNASNGFDVLCTLPYRLHSGGRIMVEVGGSGSAREIAIEVWIRDGIGGL